MSLVKTHPCVTQRIQVIRERKLVRQEEFQSTVMHKTTRASCFCKNNERNHPQISWSTSVIIDGGRKGD